MTNASMMRTAAAAAYLGVSRSTLSKWRIRGEGPPFHYCGPRLVIYYEDEIDAWLRDRGRGAPSIDRDLRTELAQPLGNARDRDGNDDDFDSSIGPGCVENC